MDLMVPRGSHRWKCARHVSVQGRIVLCLWSSSHCFIILIILLADILIDISTNKSFHCFGLNFVVPLMAMRCAGARERGAFLLLHGRPAAIPSHWSGGGSLSPLCFLA